MCNHYEMGGAAESEVYVPPQFQSQPQAQQPSHATVGDANQPSSTGTTNTTSSVANATGHQSPVVTASTGSGGQVPTASSTATAEATTGVDGPTDTKPAKGAMELLQDAANCANKINQQQWMLRGYWNKFKRSIVAIQRGFNLIASCCKNKG